MALGKHTHKRNMPASRTLGIMKDAVKEKLAAQQSNMHKDDIADHAAVAADLTQRHADAVADEQAAEQDQTALSTSVASRVPSGDVVLHQTLDEKDDSGDGGGGDGGGGGGTGGDAPPPQGPGQGPGPGGDQ